MGEILEQECVLGSEDAYRDKRMKGLFVEVQHYHQLGEPQTCFVTGRRGSGKSALALHTQQKFDNCRVFTEEDEQFDLYKEVVRDYVNVHGLTNGQITDVIHHLWRFVLHVVSLRVADEALENSNPELSKSARDELQRLGLHGLSVGRVILFAYERSTAGESGSVPSMKILTRLQDLWSDEQMCEVLKHLHVSTDEQFAVFFDSLERFEIDRLEYTRGALQGIARAMMSFSNFGGLDETFRIYVSMPGEIFEDVANIAPSKIFPKTVFVKWRFGELIYVVATRYLDMLTRANIPHDASHLSSVISKAGKPNEGGRRLRENFFYDTGILPSKVENRMGAKEDTFAYIFRHTQWRPRELITVFNRILAIAVGRGELPNISSKTIQDAIHDPLTMQTLVRDALSPFENVFERFEEAAKAVLHGQCRVMSGTELKRHSGRIHDTRRSFEVDADEFRTYLIRSGVIGVIAETDKPRDSIYTPAHFEYLVQDQIVFSKDRLYCVHPIIGDFFNMPGDDNYGAVYPVPEDERDWLNE